MTRPRGLSSRASRWFAAALAVSLGSAAPAVAQEPPTGADPEAPADLEPEVPADAGAGADQDDVAAPPPAEQAQDVPPVDPAAEAELEQLAAVAAAEPAGASVAGVPVSGYVSARYRARWTGGDDDHELSGVLSADVGDPERNPWTGHLYLRSVWDLDGGSSSDPFFDVYDTYDDGLVTKVYRAHADFHAVDGLEMVRIGRQTLDDTPVVLYLDGVRVQSEPQTEHDVQWGVYAGLPSNLFESSSSGDFMGGAMVQARPWSGGRVRADYVHVSDDYLAREHEDDLVGLGLWHSFEGGTSLEAAYTALEGSSRDMTLRANYSDAEHALVARLSYYRQLQTIDAHSVSLDPFFDSEGELRPFHQVGLLVSKGLGEHVTVDLGLDGRRVLEDSDVGRFNREFDRAFATLVLAELPAPGWTFSLTGDVWSDDDTEIESWGVDATKELSDRTWQASVGTYYALYKDNFQANRESEDVRTYYLRLAHDLTEATTVQARYEYEDSELGDYQQLRFDWTWRF